MAKIKYDVSDVEDLPDRTQAPVGIYRAKLTACEPKTSGNGNSMLECQFHITHDATGKKVKEEYADIWEYPILDHDHPFVQNKLKNFLTAFGLKPKGQIDTDKLVGTSVQVKLKSDTDQDGDYRPRIAKFMALADDPEQEEEPEEPEAEPEDEGEPIDLDALDRAELKKLIKDEELGTLADLGITKATTDDEIREIIATAMGGDEPEPEPDDEPEPEPEEGDGDGAEDGYDDMSTKDLKAELAERELPTNGGKPALIKRLRADDGTDPF